MTALIDRLQLPGERATDLLRRSTTEVSVDLAAPGQSELTLEFRDELADGLRLAPFLGRGAELAWGGQDWEVATHRRSTGTSRVSLGCRSAIMRRLAERTGAKSWGVISPSTWLEEAGRAVRARVVAEPTAKRLAIARRAEPGSEPESDLDVAEGLANELGFWLFEARGTIYFARPTWLIDQKNAVTWTPVDKKLIGTDGLVVEASDDAARAGRQPATVTATFGLDEAERYRSGTTIKLDGVTGFDGHYLVTSLRASEGSGTVTVTAATPIDPEPNRVRVPAGGSLGSITSLIPLPSVTPGGFGGPLASTFVGWALAQIGDSYVLGAGRNLADSDPDAFDCSGLVLWALSRVGITGVPGNARAQLLYCANRRATTSVEDGMRTYGALLFRTIRDVAPGTTGHVAISTGDGRTIEARGKGYGVGQFSAAGRFETAARWPGLIY